jgi:hypothetical protein
MSDPKTKKIEPFDNISDSAKIALSEATATLHIISERLQNSADSNLLSQKKQIENAVTLLRSSQTNTFNANSFLKVTENTLMKFPKSKEARMAFENQKNELSKELSDYTNKVRQLTKTCIRAEISLGISANEMDKGRTAVNELGKLGKNAKLVSTIHPAHQIVNPRTMERVEKSDIKNNSIKISRGAG